MSGRFQVFASHDQAAPPLLRWRLLSENGRQLAFSGSSFPGLEEALADAAATGADAVGAVLVLTPPTRAGWGWVLLRTTGSPVAVSTRRYARRVECLESVARFREIAPTATLSAAALRSRRPPPTTAVGA